MHLVLLAVFVALPLFGTTMAVNMSPAAGNCETRCNVPLVPLTMDFFDANRPWNVIYVSGTPPFGNTVAEERDGVPIAANYFNATDAFTKNDNSVFKYEFVATVVESVIIESTVENGETRVYKSYPLGLTVEKALLFHRCSDNGDADVDTRFIWIPHNETLSHESLKYLLGIDKHCNFRGVLHKLSDNQ